MSGQNKVVSSFQLHDVYESLRNAEGKHNAQVAKTAVGDVRRASEIERVQNSIALGGRVDAWGGEGGRRRRGRCVIAPRVAGPCDDRVNKRVQIIDLCVRIRCTHVGVRLVIDTIERLASYYVFIPFPQKIKYKNHPHTHTAISFDAHTIRRTHNVHNIVYRHIKHTY